MNAAPANLVQYLLRKHIERMASSHVVELLHSRESAALCLEDANPLIRACALDVCTIIWRQGEEPWYVQACIAAVANDIDRCVRVTAADKIYMYYYVKEYQLSRRPLAVNVNDRSNPARLRAAAYDALWRLCYGPSDVIGAERIKQAERFLNNEPVSLDYVDWSLVDRWVNSRPT